METDKNSWMAKSRVEWRSTDQAGTIITPSDARLQIGCLQRIAAATEKMASSYDQMRESRDAWQRRAERDYRNYCTERRRAAALRGVIGRMKRQGGAA